jgi:hypothetical protein
VLNLGTSRISTESRPVLVRPRRRFNRMDVMVRAAASKLACPTSTDGQDAGPACCRQFRIGGIGDQQ